MNTPQTTRGEGWNVTAPHPNRDGNPAQLKVTVGANRSLATISPWWTREDPYWDDFLFDRPILYVPRSEVTYQETKVRNQTFTVPVLVDRILRWPANDTALKGAVPSRIVASLAAWGTLSTTQLCALTGTLKQTLWRHLKRLFDHGIIERGRYTLPSGVKISTAKLWRIRVGPQFDRWITRINPALAEHVTRDATMTGRARNARHDLTAAELGIRAAETHLLGAVTGPGLTRPQHLWPWKPTRDTGHGGDGLIVRPDGLRIVTEITRVAPLRDLAEKMVRWAAELGTGDWKQNGSIILFVNVANQKNRALMNSRLRQAHETVFPTGAANPAAIQIQLTDWTVWFPEQEKVSGLFTGLHSWYRNGKGWEPMEPLNPQKLVWTPPPQVKYDWTQHNKILLPGTPAWSRHQPKQG